MRLAFGLCFGVIACSATASKPITAPTHDSTDNPTSTNSGTNSSTGLAVGARGRDIWRIYEQLELAIDENRAKLSDRRRAVHTVRVMVDDRSAKFAFARAAVVGRYAEVRGLKAVNLAREVERYAKLSNKRDPNFLEGQALRMLGTLYVFAGEYLRGGDSETGLELLEDLHQQYPDNSGHALRLAQAYIVLNDREPALPILCKLRRISNERLRPSERRILESLVTDIGGWKTVTCGQEITPA